jgi:pyridoxamine 5'-phosphate oxidase
MTEVHVGPAGEDLPELSEETAGSDPLVLFESWFEAANRASIKLPEAMTLATVGSDGRPSARVVLLRGYEEHGFMFFTNYESRKGRELAGNPRAALVFYWPELDRQVRIEGRVERVSAAVSDAYFNSRPYRSQLAAIASPQSQTIADRSVMEQRYRELEAEHRDGVVPRPSHWGGYRVVPESIEFWQSKPNRLHNRILYRRDRRGNWTMERLAP